MSCLGNSSSQVFRNCCLYRYCIFWSQTFDEKLNNKISWKVSVRVYFSLKLFELSNICVNSICSLLKVKEFLLPHSFLLDHFELLKKLRLKSSTIVII